MQNHYHDIMGLKDNKCKQLLSQLLKHNFCLCFLAVTVKI